MVRKRKRPVLRHSIRIGYLLTWMFVGLPGAIGVGIFTQVLLEMGWITAVIIILFELLAVIAGACCNAAELTNLKIGGIR